MTTPTETDDCDSPEKTDGYATPGRPCPDFIGVFNEAARLIDGLPHDEQARVLTALGILFEVTR